MSLPKAGDTVHYVNRVTGAHQRAEVIEVPKVFTYNGERLDLRVETGARRYAVPHDEGGAVATWHYPERKRS
jgi:hypothetical protein